MGVVLLKMDWTSGLREEKRMAREACWNWTAATAASLILLTNWPVSLLGFEGRTPVTLRESKRSGASTRVQTELKAKGLYRPARRRETPLLSGRCPNPFRSKSRRVSFSTNDSSVLTLS